MVGVDLPGGAVYSGLYKSTNKPMKTATIETAPTRIVLPRDSCKKLSNRVRNTIFTALKTMELERSIKLECARNIAAQYATGSPEELATRYEIRQLAYNHLETLKAIDWFKRQ